MNKIELGKTGVSVSQVSLGCMLMGGVIDKQDSWLFFSRDVQPIACL